jgi:segregation and condensation protein B
LAAVEAALFSAEEPLTIRRLSKIAELPDDSATLKLIETLQLQLQRDNSAFQLERVAGGYQFRTRPDYRPWLSRINPSKNDDRLSAAALETLTVVAYKQPITRAEIEAIRGVQSGETLRYLMDKGYLTIVGRQQSLGRPQLYGTTAKFMQVFDLSTLNDLPDPTRSS